MEVMICTPLDSASVSFGTRVNQVSLTYSIKDSRTPMRSTVVAMDAQDSVHPSEGGELYDFLKQLAQQVHAQACSNDYQDKCYDLYYILRGVDPLAEPVCEQ